LPSTSAALASKVIVAGAVKFASSSGAVRTTLGALFGGVVTVTRTVVEAAHASAASTARAVRV
jgi:hypothetical protein